MIITTAGGTALQLASTNTRGATTATLLAITLLGLTATTAREQFERERIGRWTDPPSCHNRPFHRVIWRRGSGVNAPGWWCQVDGEYVDHPEPTPP